MSCLERNSSFRIGVTPFEKSCISSKPRGESAVLEKNKIICKPLTYSTYCSLDVASSQCRIGTSRKKAAKFRLAEYLKIFPVNNGIRFKFMSEFTTIIFNLSKLNNKMCTPQFNGKF